MKGVISFTVTCWKSAGTRDIGVSDPILRIRCRFRVAAQPEVGLQFGTRRDEGVVGEAGEDRVGDGVAEGVVDGNEVEGVAV
jgi:hypothetical protein